MFKLIFTIIALHLIVSVNCNITVHRNELSEDQRDYALSIYLLEYEKGSSLNAIADALVNKFIARHGGQWFCTIATGLFAERIETQRYSLIWFSNTVSTTTTHVLLFRPGLQTPEELLYNAKFLNTNVTTVGSEMDANKKEFVTSIVVKALHGTSSNFSVIALNISNTLDSMYGKYWHVIIGQKGFEGYVRYVDGSYLDIIINDLEIKIVQTSQPQHKSDFNSLINGAVAEVEKHNITINETGLQRDVRDIVRDALYQNYVCDNDYHVNNNTNVTNSCFFAISKFINSKLEQKYNTSRWSVAVGDQSAYYDYSSALEAFEYSLGSLLVIINRFSR